MNKRFTSLVMSVVLLLSLQPLIIDAAGADDEYDIMKCAEEIQTYYDNQGTVSEIGPTDEFQRHNYESTETYNAIIEHIYEHQDELREDFAGAYVNDDGYLVVMLNCDNGSCKSFINSNFKNNDIVFSKGTGSYYEGQSKLEKIDEKIFSLQQSVAEGTISDENSKELIKLQPKTIYNSDNNTVSVAFRMMAGMSDIVDKYRTNNLKELGTFETKMTSFEKMILNEYFSAISTFSKSISEDEVITFYVLEDDQVVEETEAWRPGRGIFVYHPGAGNFSGLSTGYRAKYPYNNTTYYGFVTAGHGTSVGENVYITNSSNSAYKLGSIINRSYGGSVDVSFFNITNGNYTRSNYIYYTSSQGSTQYGTLLDGTQTLVSNGASIYKSGKATYLTHGYVSNTSLSAWYDGTYFYGLIQADRNMSSSGDSGSVTYIVSSGTTTGKAVGVLKGKVNEKTVFIKASNIRSAV